MSGTYERIRQEEQRALAERRAEAIAREPRLGEIERARGAAVQAHARALRSHADPEEAKAALKAALRALEEEQAALLLALGYPEDHLKLHHRCPACQDTGYVGAMRKQPCVCRTRRMLEAASAGAGIPEGESFESFRLALFSEEAQRKQMEQAKAIAEAYAGNFPGRPVPDTLLFLGNTGLGKSFLLHCIGNRAFARGEASVVKATAFGLSQDILRAIRAGEDGAGRFIAPKLLLLDDLGAEPDLQNITREYLFNILNERREAGRGTVIASNLGPRELQARYGDRIFSRLFDAVHSRCLILSGKSLRLVAR